MDISGINGNDYASIIAQNNGQNVADKIDSIKEEVEWGNKSIFARIFGKKKNRPERIKDEEEF